MNDYGYRDLDQIRVRQTIALLMGDIDRRDFDAAERLFAPEVLVDYTSLWGGEPVTMTREVLLQGWKALVPGFDATWHELGEITVRVEGTTAEASCPVAARHWIGTDVWLPRGEYEFRLVRRDTWGIAAMKLIVSDEIGSRSLVEAARARVASR